MSGASVPLKVAWLFVGNVVSKGAGLLREVLFAAWFGAGETAAAFRVAQTGFLMPTHAFIGDTLSAGLLPLYRRLKDESPDQARLLVLVAMAYSLIFSAVVTSALYFWAHGVVALIAPGASAAALVTAAKLLKVMALATPFYVLSGMLSYLEAAYGHYGAVAWRPLVLNLGAIAGAALAVYFDQDHWLATALLVSHLVFFGKTLLGVRALDRLLPEAKPNFAVAADVTKRFLLNMLPLLGLPLVAQGNVLVERMVSSWMGTAVIPALDYARLLLDTGVQLLAVPVGILTMATHGGQTGDDARAFARKAASMLLVISFPVAVFLSMNAEAVVTLLYARGQFGPAAVVNTSAMLVWMGGALGFVLTAYYLIKVLNSQLRNQEALWITAAGALANIGVNLALWQHLGPAVIGVGVAIQGLVLFGLAMARLGLASELKPLLLYIGFGCVLQAGSNWAMPRVLAPSVHLLFAAGIALVIWGALVAWAEPVREAVAPLLRKLPGLRRLM